MRIRSVPDVNPARFFYFLFVDEFNPFLLVVLRVYCKNLYSQVLECVAVFLYQLDGGEYKVSLRSKEIIDVSAVAASFDGGGHVRAAGCTLKGQPEDITEKLITEIIKQLDGGTVNERNPESV